MVSSLFLLSSPVSGAGVGSGVGVGSGGCVGPGAGVGPGVGVGPGAGLSLLLSSSFFALIALKRL